jgi:serine/threonine protein kinase
MADRGTIFLSHAREQGREVEAVAIKLKAKGHSVFFDADSVGTENFDDRIRTEVQRCRLFVFFVSKESVRAESYARTELRYAAGRWSNPDGQVLAIRADDVEVAAVPAYIRVLTTIQAVDGSFAVGALNLIEAALGQLKSRQHGGPQRFSAKQDQPDKRINDCAGLLVDALSRRRGLPPTGTATQEVTDEIDTLARAIRGLFRPDEGSLVAGARLTKVLGVGNFGTVWEGEDVETRRRVAVKIFRLERLAEGQMLFRFRKSIRAIRLLSEEKRLEKAPDANGTVVAFFRADPTELAFSMELLPHGNLDDIAKRGWTVEHKLDVCTRVCAAVSFSHANGVIHRDIKPANIVLNDDGQAVLTDFDIADIKFATSMSTTVEGGLGTPVFAAPEQLLDADRADERSDVYSLGRLLHYMLLERSPGYQVEKDPGLENLAGFPPALVEIVRRATQHDPARRFASANEFRDALSKSRTGAAAWRAWASRFRRWSRNNWAVVAIVSLIVVGSTTTGISQARVAARETRFSEQLSELTARLNQLIKDKDAAVDRVTEIEAELATYRQQPQSRDRDQRIADAEARLKVAKQAVDNLAKQQRALSNQIDQARTGAIGSLEKHGKVTRSAMHEAEPPQARPASSVGEPAPAKLVQEQFERDFVALAERLRKKCFVGRRSFGTVWVLFASSGRVANRWLSPDLANSRWGTCVDSFLSRLTVPPFYGDIVKISYAL